MTTCVITLGGTIGGVALENDNRAAYKNRNPVAEWINNKFSKLNISVIQFCNKDSRLLTEQDLKKIVRFINHTHYSKYIIVQGTDTAVVTGRYLQQHISNPNKSIVVTGSFSPLEFPNSDGPLNLTDAILEPARAGVHLLFARRRLNPRNTDKKFHVNDVMHSKGRFFLSTRAKKNPDRWYHQHGPAQCARYATHNTYNF